jgi:hypothetical protein
MRIQGAWCVKGRRADPGLNPIKLDVTGCRNREGAYLQEVIYQKKAELVVDLCSQLRSMSGVVICISLIR